MKICGYKKSRAFFSYILAVLITSSRVNGFTVIRSTTPNGQGDVDRFSNPSCNSFDCGIVPRRESRAVCSIHDQRCCFCQCSKNTPNYILSVRTCVANGAIDEDCNFKAEIQGDDEPLFVTDMTKSGSVQFTGGDPCSSGLQVNKWSYRLNGHNWIQGTPNNFQVVASSGNSRTMQWDRGLDPKYAGLILRFHFTCEHSLAGCLLIKSKGNYTIPIPATPLPPLGPSDVAIDATGGKTGPTLKSGTASGINGKREVEAKQTGIVVAGVMVSLAAGLLLVFSSFLFMLKKRGALGAKEQRRNTPNVAYEEPIDVSARPGQATLKATKFDNAFYSSDCVLSISAPSTTTRMSRLGPLPPLPGEEEIYEEPTITRNVAYQGLTKEGKPTEGPAAGMAPSAEQGQPPAYHILEPHASDGDYDDNVTECRNGEV